MGVFGISRASDAEPFGKGQGSCHKSQGDENHNDDQDPID